LKGLPKETAFERHLQEPFKGLLKVLERALKTFKRPC
jgi:hypothetical protein